MSRATDEEPPAQEQQIQMEGAQYRYPWSGSSDSESDAEQRETDRNPSLSPSLREPKLLASPDTEAPSSSSSPPQIPLKSEEEKDQWWQEFVKEMNQKEDDIKEKLKKIHASIEPTAKQPDHLSRLIITPTHRVGAKRARSHFDLSEVAEKKGKYADDKEGPSDAAVLPDIVEESNEEAIDMPEAINESEAIEVANNDGGEED
uniref:UPF0690 protein C1orf52 homolog n=1 Tax=Panagrellus redivivus TaxID=6233 RepID=A0A7E4UNZ9_PANRE